MDLEENVGVDQVKDRCESCGRTLTPSEIETALEGASDAFLCTACAAERVVLEEGAEEI